MNKNFCVLLRSFLLLTGLSLTAIIPAFAQTTRIHAEGQPLNRETWADGTYKWTTADSIATRFYGKVPGFYVESSTLPTAEASPDGRYFFVLSYRGKLAERVTEQQMDIFETTRVIEGVNNSMSQDSVRPIHSVKMGTGDASGHSIKYAQWASSTSIVFVGTDSSFRRHIYNFDLRSGKLIPLTDEARDFPFSVFQLMSSERSLLYRRSIPITSTPVRGPFDIQESLGRTLVPAPRDKSGELDLTNNQLNYRAEWMAMGADGKLWSLDIPKTFVVRNWFSPDGKQAVLAISPTERERLGYFKQLFLVNFEKKRVEPLGNIADVAVKPDALASRLEPTSFKVFWAANGSEMILVNVELPVKSGGPGEFQKEGVIASYRTNTKEWTVLEKLDDLTLKDRHINSIGWLTPGKELLVTRENGGQSVEGTVYANQTGKWIGRPVASTVRQPTAASKNILSNGLKISIRQSANDPPILVASNGSQEKILRGVEPELANVKIATTETFAFTTPRGVKVTGSLTLPPDRDPTVRLPLVIQNDNYYPNVFLPDGKLAVTHARQALVSSGAAVLSFSLAFPTIGGVLVQSAEEGPNFVEAIDSAVEALANRGIVDQSRVGLIGHSRLGWQVHYAVTHPGRTKVAAAIICDSVTLSYSTYPERTVVPISSLDSLEGANGGSFWDNKESWLKHDVLFNADKMEAPSLFIFSGMSGQSEGETGLQELSAMAAHRRTGRPVEYLFAPEGGHSVPGAIMRKAFLDVSVDWMNFWLSNKEDPAADKVDQYRRWRMIRDKNEFRKAEAAKSVTSSVLVEMQAAGVPDPGNNPQTLNALGYKAMYELNDPKKAIQYFQWNLKLFGNTQFLKNLQDSLAEGYLIAGEIDNAISAYTKAFELDSSNRKAASRVSQLKSDRNSLLSLQSEARKAYLESSSRKP